MTARYQSADSHPSLDLSMDDLEPHDDFSPTVPDMPSQHSGFRSREASEYSETSGRRSHSPPAWRKAGSGWFKHQHHLLLPVHHAPGASRDSSPQYHSADEDGDGDDVTGYATAVRIPLPASPTKGRTPSCSPEPRTTIGAIGRDGGSGGDILNDAHKAGVEEEEQPQSSVSENNYIRFTGSLAVQQRTDAIEAAVLCIRKAVRHVSASRYNAFLYAISTIFIYWLGAKLLSTPTSGPVPDLIKVAGLAKSFEPVIYYSEAGVAQIGELHDTGVAVWDLSESVRNTNMTSAPLIVRQLEGLSDSLKTLSEEMTSFFAGLDADVDAILLVMEWAGRELSQVSHAPPGAISSVWSNAYDLLTHTGLVSSDSLIVRELLGQTAQQRTRAALERTFREFLNVMEESIANEMQYTLQLFALFEAIDKQFLNLHRTVIREQDAQERGESDFLSSMWTRVVGVNASLLRKYEKNRDLLQSVRDRTVRNKHVLVDHNQRLVQMKSALEILRRKLVSPLVRSVNSSTVGVEEQIRGLEDTYVHLQTVRNAQKQKKMELLYGSRSTRDGLQYGTGMRPGGGRGDDGRAVHIEGHAR